MELTGTQLLALAPLDNGMAEAAAKRRKVTKIAQHGAAAGAPRKVDVTDMMKNVHGKPIVCITHDKKEFAHKFCKKYAGDTYRFKPLALNYVDDALGLRSTAGVLQAYDDGEALILEGVVHPLPREVLVALGKDDLGGYAGSQKSELIYNASKDKMVGGATSFRDLCNLESAEGLKNVSTASVQRLGLLAFFARCTEVNCDDVSLRISGGALELVLTDVSHSFTVALFGTKAKWWSTGQIFEEELYKMRSATPVDGLTNIFNRAAQRLCTPFDDEKDWGEVDWGERPGCSPTNPNGDQWVRWEHRPLDESVAELIISWTNEQIDAALNAWQRGVRDTAKLEGEVVRNAWPTPEWMAEWKEKTVDLQEKVTNGARPSLIEIARSFM